MKAKTTVTTVAKISALALPPTAPPPRKEDIINAMVERARVKCEEERQTLLKQRETLVESLNQALLEEFKKKPESFTLTIRSTYHTPELEYSLEVVPPHISKLREKVRNTPSVRDFDAAGVRRKIRDQYQGSAGDRVQALLSSPDAVKALDAALSKIV